MNTTDSWRKSLRNEIVKYNGFVNPKGCGRPKSLQKTYN